MFYMTLIPILYRSNNLHHMVVLSIETREGCIVYHSKFSNKVAFSNNNLKLLAMYLFPSFLPFKKNSTLNLKTAWIKNKKVI